MADSKIKQRVPKRSPKQPLALPVKQRDFAGRFKPRTSMGKPSAEHYTRSGVLPAVQPRKKPVLGGVYED